MEENNNFIEKNQTNAPWQKVDLRGSVTKYKTMKFKRLHTVNICTMCEDMCTHNSYVYSTFTLRLW